MSPNLVERLRRIAREKEARSKGAEPPQPEASHEACGRDQVFLEFKGSRSFEPPAIVEKTEEEERDKVVLDYAPKPCGQPAAKKRSLFSQAQKGATAPTLPPPTDRIPLGPVKKPHTHNLYLLSQFTLTDQKK
jgi:hypothetical protein